MSPRPEAYCPKGRDTRPGARGCAFRLPFRVPTQLIQTSRDDIADRLVNIISHQRLPMQEELVPAAQHRREKNDRTLYAARYVTKESLKRLGCHGIRARVQGGIRTSVLLQKRCLKAPDLAHQEKKSLTVSSCVAFLHSRNIIPSISRICAHLPYCNAKIPSFSRRARRFNCEFFCEASVFQSGAPPPD